MSPQLGRALLALRGGSWLRDARDAHVSCLFICVPSGRGDLLGYRLFRRTA